MVHGPCGGVAPAGGCEVDDRPCPFLDAVVLTTPGRVDHHPRPVELGTVLVDLVLPGTDAELRAVADTLGAVGATALIGEHLDDRSGAAPHVHARRLSDAGLPAVVTLSGRDRTADEHAAEIHRLVDADVAAVHCVTGDHPAARFGRGATATFSLDGTALAASARAAGARVSVAESPAAPPRAARSDRVAAKQRAGADVVLLNHAGSPSELIAFADRCRDAGVDAAIVAPVPVVTDHRSARALEQFPGLVLPDGLTEAVLASNDPYETGVAAAVDIGRELLASDRFAAVNLSGSAGDVTPSDRARLMVRVATELV
jgi:5,10-methylenetetrahydrofolate reductase